MNTIKRNLILSLALFHLILLQSCHEVSEFQVTRVIKNSSDFQVVMEGYIDSGNHLDQFVLNPGDSLLDRAVCIYKEVGRSSCAIETFPYDSLRLFYNEERSELFCSGLYPDCINMDKDIMGFNPFTQFEDQIGDYVEYPENTFTYTITNEDYDRAEPIGD